MKTSDYQNESIQGSTRVRLVATPSKARPDEEIANRVNALLTENNKLDFKRAMIMVMQDDPDLAMRYRDQFETSKTKTEDIQKASDTLTQLAYVKMAKSNLSYKEASQIVLNENPELAKRYVVENN